MVAREVSAPHEQRTRLAAWIMVVLLAMAYVLSLIDRVILALLVEPIKRDLLLSDTQIGLLQGFAFALFYTALALPVGWMVDRIGWRLKLVACGVFLWTAMTMACGAAANYWQLFAFRAGVGVGEATLGPAAASTIADSFPPKRLGLPMGVYALGASIGGGGSLILGAYVIAWIGSHGTMSLPLIGEVRPWQTVFFVVGAPGLLLAPLIAMLREPERTKSPAADREPVDIAALYAANKRWLLSHHVAMGLTTITLFGTTSWIIAFFARVHALAPAQAGLLAGTANLVGAIIGLVGGGILSDQIFARYGRGRFSLCAASMLLCAIAASAFPLVASAVAAAALWGGVMMLAGLPVGVAAAALAQAIPPQQRGKAIAIAGFVAGLIGFGLGPVLIGVLSDQLFTDRNGIRLSLAFVGGGASLIAALLFWWTEHAQRQCDARPSVTRSAYATVA